MATFQLVTVNVGVTTPTLAYIERSTTATGPWVRIGQTSLSGGIGYFYDNTAPFDTPVWYRFVWVDNLGQENITPGTVGPLTLVGNGNVVLSDPLRPWADLEFTFCDTPHALMDALCTFTGPELVWTRFGDREREADAGIFPILDAERPADIYARRKDHTGSIQFLSQTLAAIDSVYELFTVGGPLFLRAPAEYGRTDFFIQPGALREAFLSDVIDQRKPVRIWDAPYVIVDGPAGPQQGTDCANWCAVKAAFPTFADMTAEGGTWGDVAAGTTVCP